MGNVGIENVGISEMYQAVIFIMMGLFIYIYGSDVLYKSHSL